MLFMMCYTKRGAISPISCKLDDMNLSIKSSKYHASHNIQLITSVQNIISGEDNFMRNFKRFRWDFLRK